MNARDLVEFAALVASHRHLLRAEESRLSESGLKQYWTNSKCRFDRWGQTLRRYQREADLLGARWASDQRHVIRGTIEEVLLSEILVRVWTALITSHEGVIRDEAEPIARSVFLGHLEARHRVLDLLVHSPFAKGGEGQTLNELRRRCERWTDTLIGYLGDGGETRRFAFDPDRVRQFAHDLHHEQRAGVSRQAWSMTLASLRGAFQGALTNASPNGDLNAEIAAGILSCFPADAFDATGLFRTLWLTRMLNTTSDAQGMIDNLLDLDRRA